MAWTSIAGFVFQRQDANGDNYSGAVLKAYLPGTTTLLQMATDSTGSTLVNDVPLNSNGDPEISSNVIIPHVDQNYKLALYPTQAAADADSGAIHTVDNITVPGGSTSALDSVDRIVDLRNFAGVSTVVIVKGGAVAGDHGGGTYRLVTGAPAATYVDNGDTIIVPTGGDGSSAWLALFSGILPLSTGTGAAYTVSGFPSSFVSGATYLFEAHTANTGACTLNTVNIKLPDATDPIAGQIDGPIEMLYDSAGPTFTPLYTNPTGPISKSVNIEDEGGDLRDPGFNVSAVDTHDANYTLVLSDAGKTLLHSTAATTTHTWTIPLNSSVAFPSGTMILLKNKDINAVTITADSTATLEWINATTPADADRTLSEGGLATIQKDDTDTWSIWGNEALS